MEKLEQRGDKNSELTGEDRQQSNKKWNFEKWVNMWSKCLFLWTAEPGDLFLDQSIDEQRAESSWNNWVWSLEVWKVPGQQNIAITQWNWRWDLQCLWSTTEIPPYLSVPEEQKALALSQGVLKAPCKYLLALFELDTDRLCCSAPRCHLRAVLDNERKHTGKLHIWPECGIARKAQVLTCFGAWFCVC